MTGNYRKQLMTWCAVSLFISQAGQALIAQAAGSPEGKEKELKKEFNAQLSSAFGSDFRYHRDSTSIVILNKPYIGSIASLFLRSHVSLRYEDDAQVLSLPPGLFKTSVLPVLTRHDDWPCSTSCTDRCDSLLQTENTLRLIYSDKEVADISFKTIISSFSFVLSDVTLGLQSDLAGGTVDSTVAAGRAYIAGATSAAVREGFRQFCFPRIGTQVPRTQVPLTGAQSQWKGTIIFAIGPDSVNELFKLSDNNLAFTLTTGPFLTSAYLDANSTLLHCSVPFDPALSASRSETPESVPVTAPVFPSGPIELSHVAFFAMNQNVHSALRAYQHPLSLEVVAMRVP